MNTKKTLNKNVDLDNYESALEANFDKSEPLQEKEKLHHLTMLKQAASNYLKKDKRISIRVYGSDLENIKRLALNEGLPYQTLITSILHKFATGQIFASLYKTAE